MGADRAGLGYLASTLIEDVFSSLLSSPRPETGERPGPPCATRRPCCCPASAGWQWDC